jgi:hypothetical protein
MITNCAISKFARGLLLHALLGLPVAVIAAEEPTEERFIPNYAAGDAYYLWSTRTDLESVAGATVQVQEAGFKAPVPILSNERSRLTAGVQLRWNGLDFERSSTFGDSIDLYRLQLPIDFWHSFNDRWKAWGRVEPGLFTDFENVDGDAFAVTVLALGSYQFKPQFSAAFGVYYSRDLGEDRVLPALGVIWKPNPHWNVGLTYPRASVSYAPTATWLFSAFAGPGGAGWSVTDSASGENQRLNYKSWRAAIGAEYQFAKVAPATIWAFLAVGYEFGQELELKDGDTTLLKTDLQDGQFVTGGIRLRF